MSDLVAPSQPRHSSDTQAPYSITYPIPRTVRHNLLSHHAALGAIFAVTSAAQPDNNYQNLASIGAELQLHHGSFPNQGIGAKSQNSPSLKLRAMEAAGSGRPFILILFISSVTGIPLGDAGFCGHCKVAT